MSAHPREALSAFLDGQLPPVEERELLAHVTNCPECTEELADLRRIDGWVKASEVSAPAGYFDALPARLRPRLRTPRRRTVPNWLLAAAALLLVGLLIPITWHRAKAPESTPVLAPAAVPPRDQGGRAGERLADAPAPAAAPAETRKRAEADPPVPTLARPLPTSVPEPAQQPQPQARAVTQANSADPTSASKELGALGYAAPPPPAPPATATAPAPAGASVSLGRRDDARVGVDGERAVQGESDKLAGATQARAAEDEGKATLAFQEGAKEPPAGFETSTGTRAKTAVEPNTEEQPSRLIRTPDEARKARARWVSRAARESDPARADEARLRALEASARWAELTGLPEHRQQLEADVAAYLARPDARQSDRARRLLR